jgi:hypothetical protein
MPVAKKATSAQHGLRVLKNPHTPWEGVKGAWMFSRRTARAIRRELADHSPLAPPADPREARDKPPFRQVVPISDKMVEIRAAGFCGETPMPYKKIVKFLKLVGIFIFSAIALGFFASIGIWAAVSFLSFFGIKTL